MADNMALIWKEIPRASARATANALNAAVAVTGTEVLVAKAGWFSSKLRRIPLSSLVGVRLSPNPHTDVVALEFTDAAGLTLMFGPDLREETSRLVAVLNEQLAASRAEAV